MTYQNSGSDHTETAASASSDRLLIPEHPSNGGTLQESVVFSDRLLSSAFVWLNVGHFLQALGYSSMLLLPLYLEHLGANRALTGSIIAVASISSLCARPLIAWSLDAWGRKPTLFVGTGFVALGMWSLIGVHDIGMTLYLSRIVFGIGVGTLFTGYFTFAADIIPASRRTEGLALFGVSGLLPLIINPFASRIGIAAADLRWFLPVLGFLIALSAVALLQLREPTTQGERKKLKLSEVWETIKAPSLWSVWLATILFSGMVVVMMTFATVSAKSRGIPNATYIWLTYACGAIAVRVFGARLPEKLGTSNIVVPALGCFGLAIVLVAQAATTTQLLWAGLLGGLGHGYCFPVLTSQVVSRSPEHHRGSALTMFTALWGLSEIVLSPLLGLFADRYSDSAMFTLSASIAVLVLLGWTLLEHRYGTNLPS